MRKWLTSPSALISLAILVGCGSADPEPTATVSVSAQGYIIDSSIDSAVAHFMNENVFFGTVVDVLPAIRGVDDMGDGTSVEFVYTPAVVRVDKAYAGVLEVGAEVTVRVFGGVVDGVEFVHRAAPALNTFNRGNELAIFGGQIGSTISESAPALTPHFVYLNQGDTYFDASYALGPINGQEVSKISVAELEELIAEKYVP